MHATERLREISEKILEQTRTDLYLSLHFLGESLDSLPWQMDLSTTSIGTDAEFMRYNPRFLMQTFLQEPKWMARTYLHIILHCLLLHPMSDIPRVAAPAAGASEEGTVSAFSILKEFTDAARNENCICIFHSEGIYRCRPQREFLQRTGPSSVEPRLRHRCGVHH